MAARVALMAGSFDPMTVGHVDVARRAATLFEELVVAVGSNPAKRYLFTLEERMDQAARVLDGLPVRVVSFSGLLVDAAREHGADVLVRGVRGTTDVELELRNGQANRELSGIETLFLLSSPQHAHISSSLVREIAAYGGDFARYVPPAIADEVRTRGRR
ncbi:MAG: pantetheine-phosphate adenylyltransferase [Alphaproteobacteria bacterium]|nr:pantetheine-phosphate adenylyltransferase [Alphaproteobacteria bacterium]MCB9698942.1 pantetheine-phosphate adenylyltransferase [Alphaproteobacteria bacterium]